MTAVLQTIESNDLTLGDLFHDFYIVPDYQREYVWEDQQVEQLLNDIYLEFDSASDANSEYFVGSIVVCARPDDVYELIDGQQRMTTAYLFLCAVRDHLTALGMQPIQALAPQIAASDVDAQGRDIFRYRVDLQYEDSGRILETIAGGATDLGNLRNGTRSITNIKNAYTLIRTFLQTHFEDDTALRRFYAYFTRNVKLIRIRTQSVAHALKIFETINDRGKGLDSMDLLKNLMFMEANQSDFDTLKTRWKQLVDTLYQAHEKPLRFLRYFIFANYDVERLREEDIYNWFVTNKATCGYAADPIAFVDELLAAAQAYANYLGGRGAQGEPNRYLQNIHYLSGSARQHLILLLAAREMPQDCFIELSRHVENLFLAYIITRENTREFERRFAQWAKELRAVGSRAELDAFLATRFEPAKAQLASRFQLAFRDLDESGLQKYRMRYLLGKLTQYVNERAFPGETSAQDLATFIGGGIEVEHVLPQTPTPDVLAEFDRPELPELYIHQLGNLCLVEKPLNASLGNKAFSRKRPVYPSSQFLLTRAIAEKPAVGVNTSVDRIARLLQLEAYETWTSKDIERRQEVLARLARRVWQMPEPDPAPAA